jgi:hypothetical protein
MVAIEMSVVFYVLFIFYGVVGWSFVYSHGYERDGNIIGAFIFLSTMLILWFLHRKFLSSGKKIFIVFMLPILLARLSAAFYGSYNDQHNIISNEYLLFVSGILLIIWGFFQILIGGKARS